MTQSKLPEVLSFEVPGGKITVEHGHEHGSHQPDHASLRKAYPDSKVIIYGHTHKKVVDKADKPWIVNPGAAGRTRTHGGPSFLIISCSDVKEWEITEQHYSDNNVA